MRTAGACLLILLVVCAVDGAASGKEVASDSGCAGDD